MKTSGLGFLKSNNIQIHEISSSYRNKNLLKQVSSSVIFKVMSVAIGLLLVPAVLGKLGKESYGVWVILLSLMQWIALVDVGIGNGLKNKLTEALALNRLQSAREYVSTAYFCVLIIAVGLIIVLIPIFLLVNWNQFFNYHQSSASELTMIMMIFVSSVIIYLILSLINQVLNSLQKNSLTTLPSIFSNLVFLLIVKFLIPDVQSSLFIIVLIYCLSFILCIGAFNIAVFKRYSYLRPSLSHFKKDKIRAILSLGIKFFIIQITCIIIFSTDNLIITQLFGAAVVTTYAIPFVIFNNIGNFINMLTAPLYSSYTEAYSKGELEWIREKVLLLVKLIVPFIGGIIIVLLFFDLIIKLWIKGPINIPTYLPTLMGIYTIIMVWNNIFSFVLGGIGKINLGMYTTVFAGLINIPLAIYLGKYQNLGVNGVILSNIICLGISFFLSPIQVYYFIFKKHHTHKWDRILS